LSSALQQKMTAHKKGAHEHDAAGALDRSRKKYDQAPHRPEDF
jgi:hypothetical protein